MKTLIVSLSSWLIIIVLLLTMVYMEIKKNDHLQTYKVIYETINLR